VIVIGWCWFGWRPLPKLKLVYPNNQGDKINFYLNSKQLFYNRNLTRSYPGFWTSALISYRVFRVRCVVFFFVLKMEWFFDASFSPMWCANFNFANKGHRLEAFFCDARRSPYVENGLRLARSCRRSRRNLESCLYGQRELASMIGCEFWCWWTS